MANREVHGGLVDPFSGSAGSSIEGRAFSVAAAIAAVVLLGAAAMQANIRIAHSLIVNHVAGAWTTLATDAAAGTFYRPTVADDAFGGTRFAPLYIVLQAGLIRAGVDPLAAGHVLNVITTIALAGGLMLWVRRLGLSWLIVIAIGGAMFCTEAVRTLLSDIRSDTLAAAFCIWGLALWQRDPAGKHAHWSIVAVLLALAWVSKLTTAYGIPAAVGVAWLDGRRRQGIYLGITAIVLAASLYAIAQIASGGRMLQVFEDCAGGGMTLKSVVKSPFTFIWILRYNDLLGLAIFVFTLPTIVVLLAPTRHGGQRTSDDHSLLLPAFTILLAYVVTLVIFTSPGTSLNHMLDIQLLGWLGVAAVFRRRPALLAMGLLVFCAVGVSTVWLQADWREPSVRQEMKAALAAVGPGEKPVLAENPSVLQLGHEPVYMLDSFMFRVAAMRDPMLIKRIQTELKSKTYRGVILMGDPRTEFGQGIVERTHFYPGFCVDVLANYHVVFADEDCFSLVPNP